HEEIVEFVKKHEKVAAEEHETEVGPTPSIAIQFLSSFKEFNGFPPNSDFITTFLKDTKREECPKWIRGNDTRVVADGTKCWRCDNEEYTTSASGYDDPEISRCGDGQCGSSWTTRDSLLDWKEEIDKWNRKS